MLKYIDSTQRFSTFEDMIDISTDNFNQKFGHGINDQNQVHLGIFWARGAKWGYMTKNHSYVMAIVVRIFSKWL